MKLFFTEPIADNRLRLHVAVVLWVAVVWQLYTVVVAFRNAAVLRRMLGALGTEYPSITDVYLMSYTSFVLVPIATGLMAIHVLSKKKVSLLHSISVVLFSLIAAIVLQAWSTEAFFVPLMPLLSSMGP